jgi:hypothetical protein
LLAYSNDFTRRFAPFTSSDYDPVFFSQALGYAQEFGGGAPSRSSRVTTKTSFLRSCSMTRVEDVFYLLPD